MGIDFTLLLLLLLLNEVSDATSFEFPLYERDLIIDKEGLNIELVTNEFILVELVVVKNVVDIQMEVEIVELLRSNRLLLWVGVLLNMLLNVIVELVKPFPKLLLLISWLNGLALLIALLQKHYCFNKNYYLN